jgi:hypothetical protein
VCIENEWLLLLIAPFTLSSTCGQILLIFAYYTPDVRPGQPHAALQWEHSLLGACLILLLFFRPTVGGSIEVPEANAGLLKLLAGQSVHATSLLPDTQDRPSRHSQHRPPGAREHGGSLFLRTDNSPWTGIGFRDGATAQNALATARRLAYEALPTLRAGLADLHNALGFAEPQAFLAVTALIDFLRSTDNQLEVYLAVAYKTNLSLHPRSTGARAVAYKGFMAVARVQRVQGSCATSGRSP